MIRNFSQARQKEALASDIPLLKHNKLVREQLKDSITHKPPPITNTHLVEHKQMCNEIDALGDRYKYPQGNIYPTHAITDPRNSYNRYLKSGKTTWTTQSTITSVLLPTILIFYMLNQIEVSYIAKLYLNK